MTLKILWAIALIVYSLGKLGRSYRTTRMPNTWPFEGVSFCGGLLEFSIDFHFDNKKQKNQISI